MARSGGREFWAGGTASAKALRQHQLGMFVEHQEGPGYRID